MLSGHGLLPLPGQDGEARHFLVAALAAGLVLRLTHYLGQAGLSMDESRLANNIAAGTLARLSAPLEYDQTAPLLFLWAERLMTRAFGVNELALRALPMVAGASLLIVSYPFLRRLLGTRAAVLGVAVLAASPAMVTYSNEVKQYMLEALVAVALVHLALGTVAAPREPVSFRLAAAGAIAVWISGSAILVLAGMAPGLLLSRRPRAADAGRSVIQVCALWAISFGLAYLTVYRAPSANPYIARFWSPAFLTPDAAVLERSWAVLKDMVWGFVAGHSGLPRRADADLYVGAYAVVGVAFAVLGVRRLVRTHGSATVALLLGPLVVTLFASALRLYPAAHRLLVFAVPLVLTIGLAGLEAAFLRLSDRWRWRAWGVTGGLVVLPLLAVAALQATLLDPGSRLRALVRDLESRRGAGEPVYVFCRALPGWEFYTTDWGSPDSARLAFFNRVGRSGGPAFENAPSRGRQVPPDEGADLVYRSVHGEELFGIPTGMEYLALHGLTRRRPDPGWAEREAQRVQEVAAPGVWVIMAEFLGPEYELFEELSRLGGRVTYGRFEPGHILARYEFSAPGRRAAVPRR